MISPTVGRVVWYHPASGDLGIAVIDRAQPCAAIVAFVWHDRMVNLTVSDHYGLALCRSSIVLLQDGDIPPPAGMSYCEWMPFQKGQAAKTETLERQVGAGNAIDPGAAA